MKGRDAEAGNPEHQAQQTQDKRAEPKELKTNQGHALKVMTVTHVGVLIPESNGISMGPTTG